MANRKEHSSCNEFIVDFPAQGRISKSIQFSTLSELAFIDRPSKEEKYVKWYSEEEQIHFKRKLRIDIHRTTRMMESIPASNITKDMLIETIGIEHFLSREYIRHVVEKRRSHAAAIFAKQSLQRAEGCQNELELALVSKRNSQWARERAHELAVLHWDS